MTDSHGIDIFTIFYPHLADLYGKCMPIDHSHGSYDLQVVDMSTKITFPDLVQSHHRSTLEFGQDPKKLTWMSQEVSKWLVSGL